MIIVEISDGHRSVVYRKRVFVKLARDGFDIIDKESWNIGLEAVLGFKRALDEFDVNHYKAYGTAMFRIAKNGQRYAEYLQEKTGIEVEVIDGKKEALLIFYGAKFSKALSEDYNLIIDIGGGSVEFIITDKENMLYDYSSSIGILELYHRFNQFEPFNEDSISKIYKFLKSRTSDLQNRVNDYNIENVIGTGGSFDVLKKLSSDSNSKIYFELEKDYFKKLYNSVVHSSFEERQKLDWVPDDRKKLLVYALILMNYALTISNSPKITVTSYSMKEGIIWELMNSNK